MSEALTVNSNISHYRILSHIGAGGMGEVYLAQDTTELARTVAVKVLPVELASDKERLRRFIQEAKTASSLNHPNILTIFEIGEMDSTRFIVTEFIDGLTLRQGMAQSPFSIHEALDVAIQIASALVAAHKAKIVHRDIKPENIMVRRDDGVVKVLDFGLAKLSEPPAIAAGLINKEAETQLQLHTAPGVLMGTVAYMSPEQAGGRVVDERTDIWSLGVVLYEMIAGKVPFAGSSTNEIISAILSKEQPAPLARFAHGVPERLEEIVTKALAKDREERYQSVKDLMIDLRRLKQKLEVDAEIERSVTPAASASAAGATIGGQAAAVSTQEASAQATAVSARQPTTSAEYVIGEIKRHSRGVVLVLAALLIGISALAYFYLTRSSKTPIDSIAVLPFANVSKDPNSEYLSDGVTESIISSLSQLPQLRVMARSTVFRFKGRETDPQAVGKELGVRAVLVGRMLQQGENLIVSTELVNVSDGTQLWGEQYNRKMSDLVTVQQEIARDISERLRLRLSGEERRQLTKGSTSNTEAYQLYLQGRYHLNRQSEEGYKKSIDYFQQAIGIDPNYAQAYAGIADAYIVATDWYLPNREAMPKAKAAATRALEIDNTLVEGHVSMGTVRVFYDWDWSETEKEYRRAIELNPNYADAHVWYSFYLEVVRRQYSEGMAEAKQAQHLDPLSLSTNGALADALFIARQYDQAIEQCRKTLELDQNYWWGYAELGELYESKGQFPEAIAQLQKAKQLDNNPEILGKLGRVYARSGKRAEAQKLIDELKALSSQRYVSSTFVAEIYAALGDRDQTFEWLEKGYEERSIGMLFLKSDPLWDEFRTDPRFQDLLRRVGLPQ